MVAFVDIFLVYGEINFRLEKLDFEPFDLYLNDKYNQKEFPESKGTIKFTLFHKYLDRRVTSG